jgi:Flp pilus assembly CpaE family ATPase
MQKNSLFSEDQVEDMLGLPVTRGFANDYAAVTRAVESGKLLGPDTELGKSFAEFAAQLMDQPGAKQEPAKRQFLEFFRSAPTLATPGRD